jgi:hypothetical protein
MARRPVIKQTKRPRVKPAKRPRAGGGPGGKRKNASSMMNKTRSKLYVGAKFIGDINAGISGDPGKITTRFFKRFWLGKKFAQGLDSKWFKF